MTYVRILSLALLFLCLISSLALARLVYILPSHVRARGPSTSVRTANHRRCSVAIFLGSGGHTAEMLKLVSALSPARYGPRVYLISGTDAFSRSKVESLEASMSAAPNDYAVKVLPRARAVKQSFLTSPITTIISFASCFQLIGRAPLSAGTAATFNTHAFDVVLMNGPGTCVPLVAAVYVLRFVGMPSPKLLYVESFARVKSLSLTARILRPFVDRFVVQWPEAAGKAGHREGAVCKGWLV
ncbi:Alg14-domain-containing protein [Ceraceosorus guamensis]|uniref:UDP-N-acetylglucosamine transferase subunit ALG14 n=1 Tax=Ceraceosorus guamensis TaxID=1522189 RepID=A0A316W821_9BASI|nr:Alg14-domain-containing protein [Ceraceosorus guamensis]PWN45258.1 Alg14-domain-containing protein [Ceraceosorus guamensis]